MATPELVKTEALMTVDQFNRAEEPENYFGSGRRVAWMVLRCWREQGLTLPRCGRFSNWLRQCVVLRHSGISRTRC